MKRLLLLIPSTTYRATDFIAAAMRLGVKLLVGSERRQVLEKLTGGTVTLNFRDVEKSVRQILKLAKAQPLDAIVAVDDVAVVLAARAAEALKLPHNKPDSVATTRNKHQFRQRMAEAGLPAPKYRLMRVEGCPQTIASAVDYPCVLKPVTLSASQGVIRANNPAQFVTAFERIQSILRKSSTKRDGVESDEAARQILIESYIPGIEVALEGLLVHGHLNVLALFDKPDPLEGPFFEETIYVTPSRLSEDQQHTITEATQAAIMAIGLEEGPVHAELRLTDDGPVVIEVAARSIGGLCARILEFGAGIGLEELILRHALSLPIENIDRERRAGGVMMLPIPHTGVLRSVRGKSSALSVEGIIDLTITVPIGQDVVPLPEGRQYLGFLFAKAETAAAAEAALRSAHRHLVFDID